MELTLMERLIEQVVINAPTVIVLLYIMINQQKQINLLIDKCLRPCDDD